MREALHSENQVKRHPIPRTGEARQAWGNPTRPRWCPEDEELGLRRPLEDSLPLCKGSGKGSQHLTLVRLGVCTRVLVGLTDVLIPWQVLEDGRQWWKLRNRSGQAGYVPCNILAEARQEDVGAPLEQVIACHGSILSPTQSEPLRSGVQLVSM